MVKVFATNANGKIEFTKDELETLLNEVWKDWYTGRGMDWWTSPQTITTPYYHTGTDRITVTCGADMRGEQHG